MNRFPTMSRRFLAIAALVGCTAGLQAVPAAEQPPLMGEAIRWVPADAALCGAVLRVRQQVEAAGATRAWGRLAAMPVWKQLADAWNLPTTRVARELLYAKLTEPGTTGAQIDTLLSDPQLQRLAELGLDMLDEEFVWYADANAVDFLRLMMPQRPIHLDVRLRDGAPDPREVQRELARQMAERLAQSLADRAEPPALPSVVWAFRVSDVQRAAEQLGKLELVGSLLCWTHPGLRGRLNRRSLAGQSFITLTLNGRMAAPWLTQHLASLDVAPELAARLVDTVNGTPLVVVLGMRQDFLVLSVGPSFDAIEAMLGGSDRLIDRVELAPLRDVLQQRLTGLAYASPEMAAALREMTAPPADASKADASKANAAATADLGPILAYSIWTERGIEQRTFDWPAGKDWAEVEPLRLLSHAGEHPVVLVAWQSSMDREQLAAWADRVEQRIEQLDAWLRGRLTGVSLRYYRVSVALWRPVGRRAGEAVRQTVFPLLEHGQGMVVVDACRNDAGRLVVRPALVLDLSPAESFHATYVELEQMLAEIRAALADAEFEPRVRSQAEANRTRVYHWGDDEPDAFAPSLGLCDGVAVLALSRSHALELLKPSASPPAFLAGGPDDLLSVVYLDWSALVELARPTGHEVAVALANRIAQTDAGPSSADRWEPLHSQVDTLFDLLQVVRGVSCRGYLSDGALVTHRIVELRDVE